MRTPQIQANPDSGVAEAIALQHQRTFRDRFPATTEHSMRLVSERLGWALRDKGADNNRDVYYLARSLEILYQIWRDRDA